MRIPLTSLALALMAAACTGSSSPSDSSSQASQPPTTVGALPADPSTTTVATGTTLATSPSTAPNNATPVAAAICDPYLDYLAAFDRPHELDSLRRLDIALGFPRALSDSRAISVLRERPLPNPMSPAEARSTLIDNYRPGCGEPGPGHAGRYDRLGLERVMVSVSGAVQLLDGTELIAQDPSGPYVDAYGSRLGGIAAIEEIGGLEVVEYREDTQGIPRDLALDADLLLHGVAVVEGVEFAMVTTWEVGGEFGEETQFLELVPLDGDAPTRVGVVGTVTDAAETISYAGGYFVVTEAFFGGSDIYALGLDGDRHEVPGLPLISDGSPGVSTLPLQRATVDPAGETLAYLRVTPGVGSGGADIISTELVIQRLDDGVEAMSVAIGGRDEPFFSLDYDGHWAIALKAASLVVVDTWGAEGPELAELSIPTGATSARLLDAGLSIGP